MRTAICILLLIAWQSTNAQLHERLKAKIDSISKTQEFTPDEIIERIDEMAKSIHPDSNSIQVKNVLSYARVIQYYKKGDFEQSIKNNKYFLSRHSRDISELIRAGYYNLLGTSYYSLDKVDSATTYFIKAAEDLSKAGNIKYAGYVYNNLAGIYRKYDDCERAVNFYKKSANHLKTVKDTSSLIFAYTNMAGCLRNENKLDSASAYANIALNLSKQKVDKKGINSSYSLLAGLAQDNNDLDLARKYYAKAYAGAKAIGQMEVIHSSARGLSKLTRDKAARLKYAKEAYDLAKERYKTTEIDAGIIYADRLEENNRIEEAYNIMRQLYDKRDSMLSQEYEGIQQELMKKYELKETEQELQQKENALRLENLKSQRLLGLLGFLGLGCAGLIFLYFQKKKVAKLEQESKEKDYEKRFAQLETMILKSQMNPHFLFNSLNSIRYLFMKDEKERGLKYITKFTKLLRNTLHSGEHVLIPLVEEMELTELYIDLEQLRFEESNFSFVKKYNLSDIAEQIKIPPFIIQPIVENAFWHGLSGSDHEHKELCIDIKSNPQETIVLINDNGVGINHSKPQNDPAINKKKSYGLNIIRDRFELLNKTNAEQYKLDIGPTPIHKHGTQVKISIQHSNT